MVAPEPALPAHVADTGLLAGVDEAGLGPVLGPLVIAGSMLRGPRGADPWALLGEFVSRNRSEAGKVQVADSKKVKSGKHGLQRLERTVLVFWGALHGSIPATAFDLLENCDGDLAALQRCPWYEDLGLALPLANDRDELELAAHLLHREMAAHDIELQNLVIRPVDVEEFNASIAATDNKSDTHFRAYSEVIGRLLEHMPDGAHLVADRCGGRMHYAGGLRQQLETWQIRTMRESTDLSTYELARAEDVVKISFSARGEDRAFPTALASCAAKYVRELMMTMLNDWFQARIPDLKRTAGYYVDGNRFLLDVSPVLDANGFPVERLVRSR